MKNVEEMSETRLDGEAMKKSHRNRVPHTKKLSIWDILQTDAANRGEKSRRHPLSSSPLLSGKRQKTEKRAWASSKNRTARQQKTIEKAHKTILIPLHLRETHKKARTPFGLQPLTLFTAAVLLCKIYINIDVQRTIYWRIHKRSRANLYFSTKKRLFFSPLNSMQKSFVCYNYQIGRASCRERV